MAKLPPLRVPKRAPWMTKHKEPEKPREIPDGFPGATDLKKLVKQTSQLQAVCIINRKCSHGNTLKSFRKTIMVQYEINLNALVVHFNNLNLVKFSFSFEG